MCSLAARAVGDVGKRQHDQEKDDPSDTHELSACDVPAILWFEAGRRRQRHDDDDQRQPEKRSHATALSTA